MSLPKNGFGQFLEQHQFDVDNNAMNHGMMFWLQGIDTYNGSSSV